ncbi:unnamed protein product [Cyclocybe aegerita]|uniref:Thiamine pyrophosphokinase n=1 Tax=Cyclocybe aegerita TaxID=1973307 RepID=A0A8S0W263_CYCAE|nr:unnamed protein product [Cyclocybe aegerita]
MADVGDKIRLMTSLLSSGVEVVRHHLPLSPRWHTMSTKNTWDVSFLQGQSGFNAAKHALIILNQPFLRPLLDRLWASTEWHCCADGGANRLHDSFLDPKERLRYIPDLIKGDLDSIRPEVRRFYESLGVPVVEDDDQDSTDLMKCVVALEEKEYREEVSQYHVVLLGGLSGRLDQTIHTLSYLHKLRKRRDRVFAVTDDNVGWVLDSGEHDIQIDHNILGKTCGLLPVGIESTILSTSGLRWNLTDHPSSFDGMVSTSNHLVPEEQVVWIKTSKPIWWTVELKHIDNTTLLRNGICR